MPKFRGLFPYKDCTLVRIHTQIVASIKATGEPIVQEVNRTLAEKYAPHLLAEFEAHSKTPLTFPNRKHGNRYTGKRT